MERHREEGSVAGSSEVIVTLGEGSRVDVEIGGHHIHTDQPRADGGDDSAPAPFSLFEASIGTCAGYYVSAFLKARELPRAGVRVRQRLNFDPTTGSLQSVDLQIEVPPDFPEKYRPALVRVAEMCAVKKAIQAQPTFNTTVVSVAA
jgi:ribosomal protein S12 methylthiotransferase accessory factor